LSPRSRSVVVPSGMTTEAQQQTQIPPGMATRKVEAMRL
jgi:hypothetical protein